MSKLNVVSLAPRCLGTKTRSRSSMTSWICLHPYWLWAAPMVSTNLRRFWRSFRLSSMHLGANQVNDQPHSRVWLSFDSLSLTHSQIDWFWMVCHWHCHCPGHGVSLTLQILGVETCPFIFALSKPRSWRTDVKDMQEWMTCRSGIARNHVLNRSWMALYRLGCCTALALQFQGQPSWAGCFSGWESAMQQHGMTSKCERWSTFGTWLHVGPRPS